MIRNYYLGLTINFIRQLGSQLLLLNRETLLCDKPVLNQKFNTRRVPVEGEIINVYDVFETIESHY